MDSDKLYELAFRYKKTKLWKKLYEDDIFAVKFSDGKTGYISIMGMAGNYIAVGLYIGREGFNSYRIISDTYTPDFDFESKLLYQELLLQHECLQCTFQNKSGLSVEEINSVRDYVRRNNITLRGRNSYPQFLKYTAGYCPWIIQTEQDWQYILEALKASVALADILKKKSLQDIEKECRDDEDVILLEPVEDGYKISVTKLPEPLPVKYTVPGAFNDINVARLKNMVKRGTWECEFVQYPAFVRNNEKEVPHFPMVFLAVESGTEFILPVSLIEYFNEQADDTIDMVAEAFLMQDICPKTIYARDERTYYFLEEFCKKIRTKLVLKQKLPSLDMAEESLLEYTGNSEEDNLDDIMFVVNELLEASDRDLRDLPDFLVDQLEVLVKNNVLPEELSDKLNRVFNFTDNNNKSNVISIKSKLQDKEK